MLKSVLKFIIIVIFLTLSSCQFILKHGCIKQTKQELGLSTEDDLPYKYIDYCNCAAKWENDGYTKEKAVKECEQCLTE